MRHQCRAAYALQSHGKKANPCDCEGIDVAFLSVELSLLFLGSVSRIKVDILP